MLITRNGQAPTIHPSARVASSAQIIGNVTIGASCYIDYQVVIESSGAPIEIADHVIVFANSVIRSVGGLSRSPFPVHIADHTLISPSCTLAGCHIGRNCYVATGVMIFQGAVIGDDSRISAGATVHLKTILPPNTHVGLRHIAVPTMSGPLITADVQLAREQIAAVDFFGTVFQEERQEQQALQAKVMEKLLEEVLSWHDDTA
jgi:carbonic anhydrase/acetyltransferase-like protein (isoleucine patch superfamily)